MAELVMPRIPKGDSVIPRRKKRRMKRKRQTNRYLPFVLNEDFMITRKRPRVKRFGGALFEEDSKGFFVPLSKPKAPTKRKPRSKQQRGRDAKRRAVRADPLREVGGKRFGKGMFFRKTPAGGKASRKQRKGRDAKRKGSRAAPLAEKAQMASVAELFANDSESSEESD